MTVDKRLVTRRSGDTISVGYTTDNQPPFHALYVPISEWDNFVEQVNSFNIDEIKKERQRELIAELARLGQRVQGNHA